jgi:hypothetical protein
MRRLDGVNTSSEPFCKSPANQVVVQFEIHRASAGSGPVGNRLLAIKERLMVPYPKCGAKAGEVCKLVGKWKGSPSNLCHDERVALSKEDAIQAAARIVRSYEGIGG